MEPVRGGAPAPVQAAQPDGARYPVERPVPASAAAKGAASAGDGFPAGFPAESPDEALGQSPG